MYVGYLLDKESGMYHQGPVRRSSINLPPQNFVSTPQYPDFTGYHHVPNMDTHPQSTGSWGPSYSAPREDWGAYSLGPPNTIPTPMNNSSPGQVPYCSNEYAHMHPPGSAVLQPPPDNVNVAQLSPGRERRNSYQWMSKTAQSSSTGETIVPKCCSVYLRNREAGCATEISFLRGLVSASIYAQVMSFKIMCKIKQVPSKHTKLHTDGKGTTGKLKKPLKRSWTSRRKLRSCDSAFCRLLKFKLLWI